MTPRCARCGRTTIFPAAWVGGLPIGPTCARKAGLIEPKPRHHASEAERDTETMDLFETDKP